MVILQRSFVASWFILLVSASVGATSLRERPVSDLSRDAREIYRVKILGTNFVKAKGQVWTEYEAQVLEAFKGDTPSARRVRLHMPGGLDGDKGLRIMGLPRMEVGHEYIVFLEDPLRLEGLHRLTDWSAYVVGRDQEGRRYVQSAHVAEKASHSHEHSSARFALNRGTRSYDSFIEDVFLHMDN